MEQVIRFLEACGWARRKNAPVSRSGQQRKWESRGYQLSMANAHRRARRELQQEIRFSAACGWTRPAKRTAPVMATRRGRSRLPGTGWIARLLGFIPKRRAA
jgi:hypothetical protein